MEYIKYEIIGHCGYDDGLEKDKEIRIGTILNHNDLTGEDSTICPMFDLHPLTNKVCSVLSCIECMKLFDCIKEVE